MAKLRNVSDEILVGSKFIELKRQKKLDKTSIQSSINSLKAQEQKTKSISYVREQYYVSTSKTECVGGEWTTTLPRTINGYLWTRLVYVYTDNSISYGKESYLAREVDLEREENVQMLTVDTTDDLPETSNTTSDIADVVVGSKLVKGDYILVKFIKISPIDSKYYDEFGNEVTYSDSQTYYELSGSIMQKADISAFDYSNEYYMLLIQPFVYNSVKWVSTEDKMIMTNTLNEAVNIVKSYAQIDPNVSYTNNLALYSDYLDNLSLDLLFYDDVMALLNS